MQHIDSLDSNLRAVHLNSITNSDEMPLIRASQLAVAAVSVLISFLAYGSQLFFKSTEPYSIGLKQAVIFNLIVLCTWICYSRACFTDPGCVSLDKSSDSSKTLAYEGEEMQRRYRWCRKCGNKTPKAPRSHHCKICQRYIS